MTNPLIEPARILRDLFFEDGDFIAKSSLVPLLRALGEAERQPADPTAPAVERSYSETEAARLLGVCRDTLLQRRKAGRLMADVHYSWRAGKIRYTETHLRRIQGIDLLPGQLRLRKVS